MAGPQPSGSPDPARALRQGLLMLVGVLALGTVGLMYLEGLTPLNALYMTVITISTVGFGELKHFSPQGRILLMILIVLGLTLVAYVVKQMGTAIVEGQFQKMLGRRMMKRELEAMHDHDIVCGHGRIGRIVCEALAREQRPYVIVSADAAEADELRARGLVAVSGDATEDDVLLEAGVRRARSLVAAVSSDVANLYITLSARELTREVNPGLYILSRAADEKAMQKIRRAGADRVLSPYQIGGRRLVQALLRPRVFDYVEVLSQGGDMDLALEELPVSAECDLAGRRIRDTNLRQDYDVIIIGILDRAGSMVFNPKPDQELAAGDTLIVLGSRHQIHRLSEQLAC